MLGSPAVTPTAMPTAICNLLEIAPEPEVRASVRGAWRTAFRKHRPARRTGAGVGALRGDATSRADRRAGPEPAARGRTARAAGDLDARRGGAGLVLTSVGSMLLAGGQIRPGDRLRWSFASIGLTVGPSERSAAMPVRWAGVMGSIVVLNLAVALRGLSDRWTHGLPPMADADRVVAMSAALLLIVGCLATLRNLQPPEQGHGQTSRRREERSARHTALGGDRDRRDRRPPRRDPPRGRRRR